MNAKSKALLDSLELKKHDPEGITIEDILNAYPSMGYSTASKKMRQKIRSGEAVSCWVKKDGRWLKAMKVGK